ncbi:hypothetical protein ACSBR2_037749 [Camellia fascicularis]
MITSYIRSGDLDSALRVFENITVRITITWNSILAGFSKKPGKVREARQLFDRIPEPDTVSLNTMLACYLYNSEIGSARTFFDQIPNKDSALWNTMISGFSQNGMMKEARELFSTMPVKNSVSWNAMISGYVESGDLDSALEWDNVARVRRSMKDNKVIKIPGYSWIEVKSVVHEFRSGDRVHPELKLIREKLNEVEKKMKLEGYVPDLDFALHDVGEEQKEKLLLWHSEKLAIAYGLIRILLGTPIRVFKNLRVCGDCHRATKYISAIERREIIVRDTTRFHHFKNGICSW